jgi:hypothetical protein
MRRKTVPYFLCPSPVNSLAPSIVVDPPASQQLGEKASAPRQADADDGAQGWPQ